MARSALVLEVAADLFPDGPRKLPLAQLLWE